MAKECKKELSNFQVRNIQILTHLLSHEAVDDDIVELLRLEELDYFSLLDKIKVLEKKVNIDEKTHLLKFKNDYLTNILKTASRIIGGMKEHIYPVSFIRFDIDDFSAFNNRYGHDIGDEVLIQIAHLIRDNSRPTDYVIRFGGEEFDVILPSTDLQGALVYLDKIYSKMGQISIDYSGETLHVTMSAGVSHFQFDLSKNRYLSEADSENNFKMLQNEADNALYEAKYLGKKRYCVYSAEKKEEYSKIRKLYVK